MITFTLRLLLGCAVFCVLWAPVEWVYSHKRALLDEKVAQLDARSADIDTLVLGSSHGFYAFDPSHFPKGGFNLALVAQDHFYDRALLNHFADRLTGLSRVIVTMDWATAGYTLSRTTERWRTRVYYRHVGTLHHNDTVGEWLSAVSPFLRARRDLRFLPAFSRGEHGVTLLDADAPADARGMKPNGFYVDPFFDPTALSDTMAQKRVTLHAATNFSAEGLAENARVVDAMVDDITKRGWRPLFVAPPVTAAYRERYPAARRAECEAWIRERVARVPGAVWHDYSGDARFLPEHFSDPDHLNAAGAALFSRLVAEEVLGGG